MTDNLREIVLEGLETSKGYLPKLLEALDTVTNLLQEGKDEEGTALFLEASEGLEWYITILSGLKVLLSNKEFDGQRMDEAIIITLDKYKEAIKALESTDLVLFSDLMAYELIPEIKQWFSKNDSIISELETISH